MKSVSAALAVSAEEKQSQGVQLYEEGRYDEALVVLGEALRQSHDTPWHLWNDWGAAAFACKQMEKAEAGLKHALALNNSNVEVCANLGGLLLKLGRAAEALPFLEGAAAHSRGQHRIAVEQLLSACRERERAERGSQAAPGDGTHPSPPIVSVQVVTEPASEPFWFPDITGWFLRDEALHLFTAVQIARPVRILEIRTFYGRSTASICLAIKALRKAIEFITCDLDFGSEEEFARVFEAIHKFGNIRPPMACHEAFALGVSTLTYARRELERHGLASYVRFHAGDFRRIPGKFDFIFADVLHDQEEIQENLPAIVSKRILVRSDLSTSRLDSRGD
jgi:tetratricopeptide (TPR) repeat protein